MTRRDQDDRALGNLELPAVIKCVADRAASASGRAMAMDLRPTGDLQALECGRRLAQEMAALEGIETRAGTPRLPVSFDLGFLDDAEPFLGRLDRGGMLEGAEIVFLSRPIAPALDLRRISLEAGDAMPGLRSLVLAHGLEEPHVAERLEQLGLEISTVLDPSGGVRDTASPELRRLRQRALELRSLLSARARKLVEIHAPLLQDQYFTLRDDRYVLPVRSECRARVKGIIHGSSNSGVTLFIEPEAIVEDCNELTVVEGEVAACEREVLASLCRSLARETSVLRSIGTMLARVDLAGAVARFGADIRGSFPELTRGYELKLEGLRHPLLVLSGVDVVANDVALAGGCGWIVTGPNAGGKTVLIKAVGLATLMARTGLPIAAQAGSVVGAFGQVRAEIGDEQSIEGNLSTFSAQVVSLSTILAQAAPGMLVVLDELSAGTDPEEGAALAVAISVRLLEKGAALLVATHFDALKRLGMTDDRFVAAGMGLDLRSLEPTFRLHTGMPGSSGGIMMAERFGMPAEVIAMARDIMRHGGHTGQARMEALERLREDLETRLEEAERTGRELDSRQVKLDERERKLMNDQKRRMLNEQSYLTTELTVLRTELKHAHKVLRRRPVEVPGVHQGEQLASRVGHVLTPGGDLARLAAPRPDPKPVPAPPAVGDTVRVPRLDLEGIVERIEGTRLRVRKGSVAWTVESREVSAPAGLANEPAKEKKMQSNGGPGDPPGAEQNESYQSAYNTLDLRGKGLDEAVIDLDAFVEQALEMGMEEIFVIHGHGTGILKNGIRRHLRHLKSLASFRPGQRGEGGDGCTVCKLKVE